MGRIFIWSDLHFGHEKMYSTPFLSNKNTGEPLRPFKTCEEADNYMIDAYNRVVNKGDTVFFLGDVAITKEGLSKFHRFRNGKKFLIMGNHDIFSIADYSKYFSLSRIKGVMYFPKYKMILSHVPVHPYSLNRFPHANGEPKWKYNIHGHYHDWVIEDLEYVNACVEHTNYEPKLLEELIDVV